MAVFLRQCHLQNLPRLSQKSQLTYRSFPLFGSPGKVSALALKSEDSMNYYLFILFIHVFFKNRVVSFSKKKKKKTALQESPVYKSTKKYNKHKLILHSMKNSRQTIVLNFNINQIQSYNVNINKNENGNHTGNFIQCKDTNKTRTY